MKLVRLALLSIICCFLVLSCQPAFADTPANEKKVVVVVVDRTSIDDLTSSINYLPNIKHLLQKGGLALMNTTTAKSYTSDASYLTIGAGTKALGAEGDVLAYNFKDDYLQGKVPAGQIYTHWTGNKAGVNSIVNLGIEQLKTVNAKDDNAAVPGALGSALRSGGLKTAVFGNGDVAQDDQRRFGVLLAMDERGVVDGGDISEKVLKYNDLLPYKVNTNYASLENNFANTLKNYDFVVYDLADTARIEENANYFAPQILPVTKRKSLQAADAFVGKMLPWINAQHMLILVSPSTSSEGLKLGSSFTPLCIAGGPIKPASQLLSGSTRRPGIVMNTDIAPTVVNFFGLQKTGFSGRTITSAVSTDVFTKITNLNSASLFTSVSRFPVLQTYVVILIILLLTAIAAITLNLRCMTRLRRYLRWLLMWMSTMPATLLILPIFTVYLLQVQSLPVEFMMIIAISGLFTFLLQKFSPNHLVAFAWASLLTVVLVTGDNILGSPLALYSTLSYDPLIGARFYGIGNEYMGVLIGSFIIGYTLLFEIFPQKGKLLKVLGIFMIAFICFDLVMPQFGAKVGGALVAVLGLGYTYMLLLDKQIKVKQIAILFTVLAVVLGVMIFVDLSRPVEMQTHLARLIAAVQDKGFAAIWDIAQRKIAMNLKLIRFTRWTFVLITTLVCVGVFRFRNVLQNYPSLRKGYIGTLVAGLVAFLFNDAGVVAAATMCIIPIALLTYLILLERDKEGINSGELKKKLNG